MEVNKSFKVNASIEDTWDFFSDPQKVVTCVPGAKITEQIDDLNYKGMIEVKIGPMLSQYKGDATLEVKDDDNYVLSLMGKGVDTKGKGSASMNMKGDLKKIDDNTTEIDSTMTLNISGKVAQLGSRMIKAVNNQMFEDFKKSFINKLENPSEESDPEEDSKPINAIGVGAKVVWGGITSPFKKLFRKIKGSDKEETTEEQIDETTTQES